MKKILYISFIIIGGLMAMAYFLLNAGLGLIEVENNHKELTKGIDVIHVNMTSEDIHVYQLDTDGEIQFHYYGRSFPARKLIVERRNDNLILNSDAKYWIGNLKLDIYLPANYNRNLVIKDSSGNVTMQAVNLSQLQIETTSGSQHAENVKSPLVAFKSSSGEINIEKIETGKLDVDTHSGNLTIDDCDTENLTFQSSSGNILVNNLLGNGEVKTTSGKVSLTYLKFNMNSVNVSTTSGLISLTLPFDAGFSITSRVTSGTVQTDFSSLVAVKHALSGTTGSGLGQINLVATSGNIGIWGK